jgi:hypothetical protein
MKAEWVIIIIITIITIIITIIHIPYFTAVQLFSQQYGLTDQALLLHCSAKNFLSIWHVLSITALCITIYTV